MYIFDPKKISTWQQVQKNAEDIAALQQTIDGIDVQTSWISAETYTDETAYYQLSEITGYTPDIKVGEHVYFVASEVDAIISFIGDGEYKVKNATSRQGEQGVGVDSFVTISHTEQDGETVTTIRANMSDGETKDFEVHAENGADGAPIYIIPNGQAQQTAPTSGKKIFCVPIAALQPSSIPPKTGDGIMLPINVQDESGQQVYQVFGMIAEVTPPTFNYVIGAVIKLAAANGLNFGKYVARSFPIKGMPAGNAVNFITTSGNPNKSMRWEFIGDTPYIKAFEMNFSSLVVSFNSESLHVIFNDLTNPYTATMNNGDSFQFSVLLIFNHGAIMNYGYLANT